MPDVRPRRNYRATFKVQRLMRQIPAILCCAMLAFACVRPDPLSETLPLPEDPFETFRRDLRWNGDEAHLAISSPVYPRLTARGQAAFLRLGNARVFSDAGGGLEGHRSSPFSRAFRRLLDEPLREEAFLELSASKTPASQLFGLAGLRLVAPSHYSALAPSFRSRTDTVIVLEGCLSGSLSFAEIVGPTSRRTFDISSGAWPRDLAGLPPGA